AVAFDAVGGEANAATGKEHTCYYARVLDADLPMAVDVITDMVTSALLDAEDFETERGVILEELAMAGDDPVDVAHEQFATAVLEHCRRTYVPNELVVTAAGAVDHDTLCRQVLEAVQAGGWTLDPAAAPAARRSAGAEELPTEGRSLTVRRTTEQSNVILGC